MGMEGTKDRQSDPNGNGGNEGQTVISSWERSERRTDSHILMGTEGTKDRQSYPYGNGGNEGYSHIPMEIQGAKDIE